MSFAVKSSVFGGWLEYTEANELGYENIPFDLKVVNEHGEDMTAMYRLSCSYGRIVIAPRPLAVTSEGGSKVYDGQPLPEFTGYTVGEGETVKDHRVSVSFNALSYTEAGSYENSFSVKVISLCPVVCQRTASTIMGSENAGYSKGIIAAAVRAWKVFGERRSL